MPQPPSPPFVPGAQTQPRQLVRWLDVNPQGGPLTRFETFITLPAFSVAVNWKGYSEIVAAFNFEGPNNFILQGVSADVPLSPNYALAISWRTISGQMFRYFLWNNVGEVIYFPEILYAGQIIKKNFRLEIWSTNSSPAVQTSPIVFYTSVLGNEDYRYSNDQTLVNADSVVTNFQNVNGAISLPSTVGLAYWWKPSGIQGAITSWVDSVVGNSMVPVVGNPSLITTGLPNNVKGMNSSTGNLNSNFTAFGQTYNTIALVFQARNTAGNLLSDASNDNVINYSGGSGIITLKNQGNTVCTVSGIVNLSWYVIVVAVNTLYVYNLSTGALLGSGSGAATIGTATTIQWGGNGDYYTDLILGLNKANSNDAQSIANYMSYTYYLNGWSLPLTFPANSVSQGN